MNDVKNSSFIFMQIAIVASYNHIHDLKLFCSWVCDYKAFYHVPQNTVEIAIVKMIDLNTSHKHMDCYGQYSS